MLLRKIKLYLHKLNLIHEELKQFRSILYKLQESLGRVEERQLQVLKDRNLIDNEFQVFSQWGEDGIIQFLLRHIEVSRKVFVEFGVQNYQESNTRFLIINNNWSGLVIEANSDDCSYIKQDPVYWKYNLKAANSFITKDNINQLLIENGIEGEIGILSIDVDGNDYWIWEQINVVSPAIIIAEYNYRFGKDKALTVPYDEHFVRCKAHHSQIYYGASLKALYMLAQQKGYAFVGCNSAGNNAFFVRKDLKPDYLKELTVEEAYVEGKFRESRDQEGNLLYLSSEEEKQLLSSLPLIEITETKNNQPCLQLS